MNVNSKHPMILPSNHKLSKMIVLERHCETHLGVELLINDLRTKYWITKVQNLVKTVKHSCITCKKTYAPTHHQKMGDLLEVRTETGRPVFSYTEVDIFGPFYVRQGRSEVKRYGCIYTCLTTRAIHLEVLCSLETDTFFIGFSDLQLEEVSHSEYSLIMGQI